MKKIIRMAGPVAYSSNLKQSIQWQIGNFNSWYYHQYNRVITINGFRRLFIIFMAYLTVTLAVALATSFSAKAALTCQNFQPERKVIHLNSVSVSAHAINNASSGYNTAIYHYHFPIELHADITTCLNQISLSSKNGLVNGHVEAQPLPDMGAYFFNNLFKTNIDGIAVSYKYQADGLRGIANIPIPDRYTINSLTYGGTDYSYGNPLGLSYAKNFVNTADPSNIVISQPDARLALVITRADFISGDIDAASFPHIELAYYPEGSAERLVLGEISFTGTIHIVNPTCTTPNYSYSLGEHRPAEFTGVNSTSSWVSTPVTLTGCSVFHGNLRDGTIGTTIAESMPGVYSNTVSAANNPNTVSMTLTPNTSWINQQMGIISLSTGSGSATGVGIQLGVKDSGGNFIVHDQRSPIEINPTLGTSGSLTFPLGARYIQTTSSITGGTANASLIYSIDYQ